MKRLLGNWVFAGLFAAVGIFGLSGCDDFEQRKHLILKKERSFSTLVSMIVHGLN